MTVVRLKVGNKYRAVRDVRYDSQKEANRSYELRLLQVAGEISELREKVRYELIPKQNGERAMHYVADFQYREKGQLVVEDVKGIRTPLYIAKRKLMLLVHGIRVRET